MLAAVLAIVSPIPRAAIEPRFRAKLSNRKSERPALMLGNAAQARRSLARR